MGKGQFICPCAASCRWLVSRKTRSRGKIANSARKYQHDPRMHLFIQHFAARNVMGLVAQPGTCSPRETPLSVLGRAGGLKAVGSERPADHIVLFPASSKSAAPVSACYAGEDHAITEKATICDTSQSPGRLTPVSTGGPPPIGPGASVTPIEIDLIAGCLAFNAWLGFSLVRFNVFDTTRQN